MAESSYLGVPFKRVMLVFCCFGCEVKRVAYKKLWLTAGLLGVSFLKHTVLSGSDAGKVTCMLLHSNMMHMCSFTEQRRCFISIFVRHTAHSKYFTEFGPRSPERGCGCWRGRKHLKHCADAELMEKRWSAARNQYGPPRCANVDVVSVSRWANVVGLHCYELTS